MDERGHDRERSAAGLAQVIGLRAQRADLTKVAVQATPNEARQRDMAQAVMRGDGGNEGGQVDGGRWHGTSLWTLAVLARATGWTSTPKRREGQAETWTSRTRVMLGRRRECELPGANASNNNRLWQRRGNGAAIIHTRSIPRNTKGFAAPSWRD